jgi:hypothetical protein
MTYDAIFFTEITDTIGGAVPTIGAYKCAHVLRKNGYRCLVVRLFGWYDITELKMLMDRSIGDRTRMIGFSTTFLRQKILTPDRGYQYNILPNHRVFPQGKDVEDEFVDYCLKLNSQIKFVAGGAGVTENWQNRNIDYAFIGFSESSIVNLMDHLSRGKELTSSRKNIWGTIIIDDRLATTYDFIHDRMEWLPEDVVNVKVLPIEIGRGCIFRCKFCAFPLNGKKNLDFVKLPDLLYQELQSNYDRYGITDYNIVDDTFNDHVEKLKALTKMTQRLSFQPRFWGYNRLDLICTHPETLPMLHDIGLRALYFGIETLDIKTGRIIGKGFDRQRQINMIQHIRSNYPDMAMHGSFIAGLPAESVQSIKSTCDMLQKQEIPLHSWNMKPLNIYLKSGFPSDVDLNWKKYGYRDCGKENVFGASLSPAILNWGNEHTTLEYTTKFCNEFVSDSYANPALHLAGIISMSIAGLGNPELDFEKNSQTSQLQIDFYKIETEFFLHVAQYKQQLLKMVSNTLADSI